jgi:hypothetical protein
LATNTNQIAIGVATVSIGAYFTAGGAGSLTDVGHTKGPTTLSIAYEDYELVTEQSFGPLRNIPISAKVNVKAMMNEATLDNMRVAARQATAQLSGSAPNKTLLVGNINEQYHQIQIVTKGPAGAAGVASTRTITIWRGIVRNVEEISYGKQPEQTFTVTIACMFDDSVATGDKFLKIVDSGGS